MKHYQMTIGERSTISWGAVHSSERVREEAVTTSINLLVSTLMIYSKTLTSLDTIIICIIKDISRGTFRPMKKHAAGTGCTFKPMKKHAAGTGCTFKPMKKHAAGTECTFSTLSVVTYSMIWRGCSLLMNTRLGLKARFTDPPGSTVGLSHSAGATWLQHTQTALELMRMWKCLLEVLTETVI